MATGGDVRIVELVQAFVWTCDDCGKDNFERAITLSPESIDPDEVIAASGEDAETIREWLESGQSGDWVTAPKRVRCRSCGSEFGAAAD